MCLALPGEVLDVRNDALRTARVSFDGVVKEVCLVYVPEAEAGAYVLVHAGFAIAVVSRAHADDVRRTLAAGPVADAALANAAAADAAPVGTEAAPPPAGRTR